MVPSDSDCVAFEEETVKNIQQRTFENSALQRDAVGPKSRRFGVTWKVTIGLVGLIAVLGVLIIAVVYAFTRTALRKQVDERMLAIGLNLSDVAGGHVVRKNVLELFALVRKYALLPGVAYVLIEDGRGTVIAHSLGVFPPELEKSRGDCQQPQVRSLKFRNKMVYEACVPILEGQVGATHIAMQADFVEEEIRRALFPILLSITIILLWAMILAVLLAPVVTRRIRNLNDMAERMSKGDIETPVKIKSRDEIGEMARSLERMRASLKAVLSLHSRRYS